MTMTDPIADMLTRIRNAVTAQMKDVPIPSSRLKVEIAKLLKEEGYIKNFKVVDDKLQGTLHVFLKYGEGKGNAISGLQRVSKPGCRIYCRADSVPKVLDGLGIVIVSTSKGLLTGKQCEEQAAGGEVLCRVW